MTGRRALAVASVTAAVVAIAGCSPQDPPAPSASIPATASTSPSASTADRPDTGVEAWPDHGDFVIDANKAVLPAYNLTTEQRWEDHDYLWRIANTAQARWVGSWEDDVRVAGLAREVYKKAADTGRVGLIAYQGMRDYPCERAAAETELSLAYEARTEALVDELPGIGSQAWIVVEPALIPTLDTCEGDPRGNWLDYASNTIAANGATVYLDASGLTDRSPEEAAALLATLDLAPVAGFSLNVGRHHATADQVAWGEELLAELEALGVPVDEPRPGNDPGEPGLGLIVDTSRNGVPLDGEQCNAAEAGIGAAPRLVGEGALDAVVWIKRPGESDGSCNGGLGIGQFAQAKALELARRGQLGPTDSK